MKKLLLLAGILLVWASTMAQIEGIRWKKIIGTTADESLDKIIPAPDGGYLLIGQVLYNQLTSQLLLIKVTREGAVQWRREYGGTGSEWASGGVPTPDGGFIIAGGTSTVDGSGGISDHHGVDSAALNYYDQSDEDLWVTKIDAIGNIVWTKVIGGSRWDCPWDIIRTTDNHYVVAGFSASGDGDLAGVRRSALDTRATADMWILKFNEQGDLLWQRCYGGSRWDDGLSIVENSTGLMTAGLTASDDIDRQSTRQFPYWQNDVWVVQLDHSGNIVWEKAYGGSGQEQAFKIVRYGNNFMVGGHTESNDGDVVGFHPGMNQFIKDFWLLEVDAAGNKVWQQPIGTARSEWFGDMAIDANKNLVLIGETADWYPSYSYPTIVHLDANKNIVKNEESAAMVGARLESVLALNDGTYLMSASVGIAGWYKVPGDHLYGKTDGLLLSYGSINTIKGRVFLDQNGNQLYDTGEKLLPNFKVIASKRDATMGGFTTTGNYQLTVDTGDYSLTVQHDNLNFTIQPSAVPVGFTTYFNTAVRDFAVTPVASKDDLGVALIPLTPARPGFQADYRLKVYNQGTTNRQPLLQLDKDGRQTMVSSILSTSSVAGNRLQWQLPVMAPFDTVSINVTLQLATPPTLNIGDSLKLFLAVDPLGDQTPNDNADTLKQLVVGSFDPNDKTETHGGVITPAQISGADPLTYVIRFQNMGTDTAFNVIVRDTLDHRLNTATLQMIDASHAYQLNIENEKLTWSFNNIKLPDHHINEPASHGYIVYRIKPLPTVPVGDTIKNGAGIYFDYNLPVQTNIENTVVMSLSTLPVNFSFLSALWQEAGVAVKWTTALEQQVSHFEVLYSIDGVHFTVIGQVPAGGNHYTFRHTHPVDGYNYYRIRSVDLDGDYDYSAIARVKGSQPTLLLATIYPNPVQGRSINVTLNGTPGQTVQLQVLHLSGRVLLTQQHNPAGGQVNTALHLGQMPKGTYLLKVSAGLQMQTSTIILQ